MLYTYTSQVGQYGVEESAIAVDEKAQDSAHLAFSTIAVCCCRQSAVAALFARRLCACRCDVVALRMNEMLSGNFGCVETVFCAFLRPLRLPLPLSRSFSKQRNDNSKNGNATAATAPAAVVVVL
jgi:hypothetical protein